MPYSLKLPPQPSHQRWKVKILDNELPFETPHVTIRHGKRHWRIDLRSGDFMDEKPSPKDVPDAVMEAIKDNWSTLKREWNARHPNNPV